jgi:hypothetical protein
MHRRPDGEVSSDRSGSVRGPMDGSLEPTGLPTSDSDFNLTETPGALRRPEACCFGLQMRPGALSPRHVNVSYAGRPQ